MSNFPSHDLETAPEASKPFLEQAEKKFGSIPGLAKVLAESPQALEAYFTLNKLFTETAFDADELTVVWQAINVENSCHYCVPAHTGIAKMMGVSDEITEALRNETALPSAKLEALRTLTVQVVRGRGFVSEEQQKAFFDAGYGPRAILDVVLGLAHKTISNYTNHLSNTALDEQFKPMAWTRATSPLEV